MNGPWPNPARVVYRSVLELLPAAVLALIAPLAIAQPAPDQAWPPPGDTIIVTGAPASAPMLVPRSENASPGICESFLPPGLTGKQSSGATLFSYRVTPGGQVRDVRLYRSSGDPSLDAAALTCADGAYRWPAIVSGKPADVTSVGTVDWARWPSPQFDTNPEGGGQNCMMFYPPSAVRNDEQGSVIVGYRIDRDGNTTDATIVDSNAGDRLDAASLKCVARFRYYPFSQNGQPVQVDKSARIVWRLEGIR